MEESPKNVSPLDALAALIAASSAASDYNTAFFAKEGIPPQEACPRCGVEAADLVCDICQQSICWLCSATDPDGTVCRECSAEIANDHAYRDDSLWLIY